MIERRIIRGAPGRWWRNATPDVWWQFRATLVNTCPVCWGLHGAFSDRPWPIPVHPHCRCRQWAVGPGDWAPEISLDLAELVRRSGPDARLVILGLSSLKLLRAGLVELEDLVTPWRARALWEVVRRRRLTVEQLVAAGVPLGIARMAVARARWETLGAAEAKARRELRGRLAAAEVKIAAAAGAGLAGSSAWDDLQIPPVAWVGRALSGVATWPWP